MSFPLYNRGWKQDIAREFPNNEVLFIDSPLYVHLQQKRMESRVARAIEFINKSSEPVFILSHSFGGILARVIIQKVEPKKICGVITMASPHTMNYAFVPYAQKRLGVYKKQIPHDIPIQTYGGWFDMVVAFWFSSMKNVPHENLLANHKSFLFNKKVRRMIIQKMRDMIKQKDI